LTTPPFTYALSAYKTIISSYLARCKYLFIAYNAKKPNILTISYGRDPSTQYLTGRTWKKKPSCR